VNELALKKFQIQFSGNFEKNMKLMVLFYPMLTDKEANKNIELGLSYFHAILLVQNLINDFNFYRYKSGDNIPLKIEIKLGEESTKLI